MRKVFQGLKSALLGLMLVCVFVQLPILAMAKGYSSKPITGVYDIVQMEAVTVEASGTYGCSAAIDDCAVFYIRPYDLPATMDLVVQAGANSYTATYSFKIEAAAGNINAEFGPFYCNPFGSVNWYMGMTPTGLDESTTANVYIRSYNPAKHNF